METKPLGELLTKEQLSSVLTILNTWPDDSLTRIRKLREYLNQFATELEHKGIVADYLAYAIEANVQNIMNQNIKRN